MKEKVNDETHGNCNSHPSLVKSLLPNTLNKILDLSNFPPISLDTNYLDPDILQKCAKFLEVCR